MNTEVGSFRRLKTTIPQIPQPGGMKCDAQELILTTRFSLMSALTVMGWKDDVAGEDMVAKIGSL